MPISFKQDLETVDKATIENLPCSNLVAEVSESLNLKTTAGREYVRMALANALLCDRKQLDYGPKNISGFGVFGIVVRMNDKFERLKTLFGKGRRRKAVNESIQDSFRDLANYSVIALLVDMNLWPEEEPHSKPQPLSK